MLFLPPSIALTGFADGSRYPLSADPLPPHLAHPDAIAIATQSQQGATRQKSGCAVSNASA